MYTVASVLAWGGALADRAPGRRVGGGPPPAEGQPAPPAPAGQELHQQEDQPDGPAPGPDGHGRAAGPATVGDLGGVESGTSPEPHGRSVPLLARFHPEGGWNGAKATPTACLCLDRHIAAGACSGRELRRPGRT